MDWADFARIILCSPVRPGIFGLDAPLPCESGQEQPDGGDRREPEKHGLRYLGLCALRRGPFFAICMSALSALSRTVMNVLGV